MDALRTIAIYSLLLIWALCLALLALTEGGRQALASGLADPLSRASPPSADVAIG